MIFSSVAKALSSGPVGTGLAQQAPAAQVLATRGKIGYMNTKIRARTYKSTAKERRKQMKRDRMAGSNIKDSSEEVPPFFIPQRYKLLFKVMEEHRNCVRIGRKPMPSDVKKALAEQAKAYNEFKCAEKVVMQQERALNKIVAMEAMDATLFLSDNLLNEALSDTGLQGSQEMEEFKPSIVYME